MKKLHDYVVKATLTQRRYLIELLQATLPPYITKLVNWKQVSMLSETLSEPSKPPGPLQRPIYADMAVRLPLLEPASVCICVVIEIKSAYTRTTGLQLDRYSHAMLQRYMDCNYIIRLLFHTGRQPWPAGNQGMLPESLAPACRLLFPFDTVIADVHDEQLLQRLHSPGLRALVVTARDVWRIDSGAEYWAYVRKWLMPLARADAALCKLLLWYSLEMLQRKIHIDPATLQQYIDIGGENDEKGVKLIMTMAKYLTKQGHDEGLAEGLAQGRTEGLVEGRTKGRTEGLVEGRTKGRTEGLVEGRTKGRTEGLVEGRTKGRTEGLLEGRTKGLVEGRTEAARRLFSKGFDNGMVHEITGLQIADIEQLRNGSERGDD